MQITKINETYIKQIANIETMCFSTPWSESALLEELSNESAVFLCAVEENEVLGYVGFHFVLDEGYIALVAVHPNHRKKGIGRALVKKAIEKAKELGLSFLSLEVRVSNIPAQNLYQSLGFENLGKRPNFYTLPTEDAYIMTKTF